MICIINWFPIKKFIYYFHSQDEIVRDRVIFLRKQVNFSSFVQVNGPYVRLKAKVKHLVVKME